MSNSIQFTVSVVKTPTRYGFLHLKEVPQIIRTESFDDRKSAKAFMRDMATKYDLKKYGMNIANITSNLELQTNF